MDSSKIDRLFFLCLPFFPFFFCLFVSTQSANILASLSGTLNESNENFLYWRETIQCLVSIRNLMARGKPKITLNLNLDLFGTDTYAGDLDRFSRLVPR